MSCITGEIGAGTFRARVREAGLQQGADALKLPSMLSVELDPSSQRDLRVILSDNPEQKKHPFTVKRAPSTLREVDYLTAIVAEDVSMRPLWLTTDNGWQQIFRTQQHECDASSVARDGSRESV
ncbi:hypothetical protein ACG7TL_008261 [Trametes sanguinea]